MSKVLLANDRIIDDSAFLSIGFVDISQDAASREWTTSAGERARFDVAQALEELKADPRLGVRLLSAAGDGVPLWAGAMAGERVGGRTAGVRVFRRREGDVYDGDNAFGEFLGRVRDAYREYLKDAVIAEEPVRPGQVRTDFTPRGSFQSDVEVEEEEGRSFIHVDQYRPARYRRDAGLDGTTGHAQRASDDEVRFHSFVCPFGTSYPAPVVVGSEAEASMLYERALRGELDWKALFSDLTDRGFLAKLTDRQKEAMAADYRAQFAWMREQIATDFTLRERTVVASGALVSDASMGRSQFDPELAPSPAHVLARYINNPVLLYTPSQNGVVRALSSPAKREPERFRMDDAGDGTLRVLVVASDTIGGRIPGRRAVSKKAYVEKTARDGRKVVVEDKKWEIPMKSKEDVDADYARFAARMDELLSGVPEGTRVELVTGNASGLGPTVGVGGPQMVERYVREKHGKVSGWDFTRASHTERRRGGAEAGPADGNLSCVVMEHFSECVPVLSGARPSVSFLLDENDEESRVTFRSGQGLDSQAAVCFSVREDANNRNVLSLGSYVSDRGLPLVHVQENRTEEEQRLALSSGAVLSLSELSGEVELAEGLFREGDRNAWDLGEGSNNLSFIDTENGVAVPFVTNLYPAAVSVGGVSFNSALGAYVALEAVRCGEGDSRSLRSVKAAEGSTAELAGILSAMEGRHGAPDPLVQEKLLRQSVRLMASANAPFADYLSGLDSREVVMPSTAGGTVLFTDLGGNGLNRFGRVLSAERDRMVAIREARRLQEEEERRSLIQEAARKQAVTAGLHAEGEKVRDGLPAALPEKVDAVWFLGTNSPAQLELPDGGHSFEPWNDEGGEEPLKRGVASADYLSDGEGGQVRNDYVFLFASDLQATLGRRPVKNIADSVDLTGLTRVDRTTGESFVCAYGIPVRFDPKGNEDGNDDGLPCSYRLDRDASAFVDSVVITDSQARSAALRRGLSLSLLCREYRHGETFYPLGNVFKDKVYSKREDGMVDNPHRSRLNLETVERYIGMLERGRPYPLNFIALPQESYEAADDPRRREAFERELREARENHIVRVPHYVSAEGRFLADLNMALKVASATAVSLGVPLRFPLDREGRIDLGPGVPEELRKIAERKIDSFIGVVDEKDVFSGPLPVLETLSLYEVSRHAPSMTKVGTDVHLRPNDLVYAFGQYDFSGIFAGQVCSLHQMGFRMEDGTVFLLTDAKSTRSVSDPATLNAYLSYSKNDETRFVIKSTDPEKTPAFLAALRAYVERAKRVRVKARLVRESEKEADGESLEGFINLLSSNSDEFVGADETRVESFGTKTVAVGGVTFSTVDGAATAFVAREYGKDTPALLGRIAAIEADTKLPYGDKVAKLRGMRDRWADQEVTSAYKRILRRKMLEVPADKIASMTYAQKVKAARELDSGWNVDRVAAAREKDCRARAERLVYDMRTVTERSHDVGREASVFNLSNRFDELDTEKVYWGKVDARDGFAGYAQISYTLPDGTDGPWFTVRDRDLAEDMVLSMVNRTYRTDTKVLPSAKVLRMLMVAEAVRNAGARFREMDLAPEEKRGIDSRVVTLGGAAPDAPAGEAPVKEFRGEYAWLSNMHRCPVAYDGVVFPSAENAFQAAKCADPEARKPFLTLSPSEAKAYGRTVTLREGWDGMKDGVMREVVADKFARNAALRARLAATGSALLSEGNGWGDRYWGVDLATGEGRNVLGGILMDVRSSIAEAPEVSVPHKHEPELFVTYYGSRDVPEDAFRVQLSTSCPKGMEMDVELKAAYPDFKTMVGPHKEGAIDDAEYTRRYREKVLDARKDDLLRYVGQIREMAGDRDVYFFCYCRPGQFCHRYLFNNFLNANGIACRENPADRALYREGRVKLLNDDVPAVQAEPELPFPAEAAEVRPVKVSSYEGAWTREAVAADTGRLYVFTDNTDRDSGRGVVDPSSDYYRAYGNGKDPLHYPTQTSAVIRGLGNALPVSTQRWYHEGAKGVAGRWQDADAEEFRRVVSSEFAAIREAVASGRYDEVVFPGGDGLFGGRISAITEERVPVLYGILKEEYGSFVSFCEGLGRDAGEALGAPAPDVTFTVSSGDYRQRTRENANADDVDFTLALAVDFSTGGEVATRKEAGSSYIGADLPRLEGGKGLDLSDEAVAGVVSRVFDALPEEYQNGEPVGLNIAGNGLYTLSASGVTQEQADEAVTRVLAGLRERGVVLSSLRSGGQTGIDEAAYAAGAVLGVPVTIHAPKGYRFRGADNRDRRDEAAFKARFEGKDVAALREKVRRGARRSVRKGAAGKLNQKGL